MNSGGGTRIKILEAMATGLPVVTTSIGNEGIAAIEGKEVLVADKPSDFSEKIVMLLKNTAISKKIGLSGKEFVGIKYDWSAICNILEKSCLNLANPKDD